MSEITTDDKNEIIALFDGWELAARDVLIESKETPDSYSAVTFDTFIKDGNKRYHNDLKYHSDWSWLMPVVLKIKDHKQSCIRLPMNGIPDSVTPYIQAMQPMNRALIKADLKGVYEGVYQFIQWYQKQKEQQP